MYTSGRTVKSSKPAKPSTVASATREAHRLAKKHLDWLAGYDLITFSSALTADPVTLAPQVRTMITFPESMDASDLACAVETLPGYVSSTWTTVSITITRRA